MKHEAFQSSNESQVQTPFTGFEANTLHRYPWICASEMQYMAHTLLALTCTRS